MREAGIPGRVVARIAPWAALFRLPNLATAAGDAVAGGSLAVALAGGTAPRGAVRAVFLAAASEFFLYLAGLVDNDICDLEADRASGKRRPLATGAISRREAAAARAVCILAAVAAAWPAMRPGAGPEHWPWFAATLATALSVFLYNRTKERFPALGRLLMGSCRGFALVAGFAAAASAFPQGTFLPRAALPPLAAAALGWTLYVAGITRLGEREETAGAPLGAARFVPAVFAVLPFAAHFSAVLPGAALPLPTAAAAAFAAAAAAKWCLAVAPLGRPHSPRDRGRAVGRTIGGLLLMQTALAVCGAPGAATVPAFAAFAAACWCARFAAHWLAPSISGS